MFLGEFWETIPVLVIVLVFTFVSMPVTKDLLMSSVSLPKEIFWGAGEIAKAKEIVRS